jgi:hypothetical protein
LGINIAIGIEVVFCYQLGHIHSSKLWIHHSRFGPL